MATAAANRPMSALELGLLVTLSVLWGGSFFFVGIAVKDLPPFTIVVARVAIAALALHGLLWLLGHKLPRDARAWVAFFGMGLLNNVVPFTLIVWGQTHIASGLAAILNATTPLFTLIVAHLATRDEKMSAGGVAGVVVGFAGVGIMVGGTALRSLGTDVIAQIAILAAALSYAFAAVFGRRFATMGIAPVATATGQLTASSVVLLPVMVLVDHPWTLPMPSYSTIAALANLALVSTALAYIIYFRILQSAGATNLLLVTFLIPVSAILLGTLVLGETLQPKHLMGMALIGVGLAAIDGRPWRMLTRTLALRN
jgi:drug/metabolite transporter (DMT)-like permease